MVLSTQPVSEEQVTCNFSLCYCQKIIATQRALIKMPFGEVIIGSPGSGKSTYAYGKYQASRHNNRRVKFELTDLSSSLLHSNANVLLSIWTQRMITYNTHAV